MSSGVIMGEPYDKAFFASASFLAATAVSVDSWVIRKAPYFLTITPISVKRSDPPSKLNPSLSPAPLPLRAFRMESSRLICSA
jgi:hypothetical protein